MKHSPLLLLLALVAVPALGQEVSAAQALESLRPLIPGATGQPLPARVSEIGDCADGIVYDDGVDPLGFDYSGAKPAPATYTAAMRFKLPGSKNRINAVCLRLAQYITLFEGDSQIPLDIDVWAADGPGGGPGTLLGSAHNLLALPVPRAYCFDDVSPFFRFQFAGGIVVPTDTVYIGATWGVGTLYDHDLATTELCGYTDGTGNQPGYVGPSRPPAQKLGVVGSVPFYRSLSIRAEVEAVEADPPPPSVPPLLSSQYTNFRFWVRISDTRVGTAVPGCLPETVCVAGAIPTRAEVFVRIVGPKSNGFLWTNVVKFNVTKTEVWIQQISTGDTKYYLLPALPTDSATLPGLVDKSGFHP
ncbi:MAG: hypothetical protein ABJC13_09700 [Acidobacteriota bacterium]